MSPSLDMDDWKQGLGPLLRREIRSCLKEDKVSYWFNALLIIPVGVNYIQVLEVSLKQASSFRVIRDLLRQLNFIFSEAGF